MKIDGTIVNTTGENDLVKIGGAVKKTVTLENIQMPTGSVMFYSDSSASSYYGAKVTVTPHIN